MAQAVTTKQSAADRVSTGISIPIVNDTKTGRELLFFDVGAPGNTNAFVGPILFGIIILLGITLIGVTIYSINDNLKKKDTGPANAGIWYLIINGIVGVFIYGVLRLRRYENRNISYPLFLNQYNPAWGPNWDLDRGKVFIWFLFLLAFSPAIVFIELADKLYLAFRKIFRSDQEELDMTFAERAREKLSQLPVIGSLARTVDLDTSERFTYLFGTLSYDREDAGSIFREGSDTVRTPVLLCSFFVALCLTLPFAIVTGTGQELNGDTWRNNIAPVSTVISFLVIVFILGTLQGYGDTVSLDRKKQKVPTDNRAGIFKKQQKVQGKQAVASNQSGGAAATAQSNQSGGAAATAQSNQSGGAAATAQSNQTGGAAVTSSDPANTSGAIRIRNKRALDRAQAAVDADDGELYDGGDINDIFGPLFSPRKPRKRSPAKKMKKKKK